MKIKIIRGIYGAKESGRIVEKTKEHGPFEVNDEEGARLISLEIAKEVTGEILMHGQIRKSGSDDMDAGEYQEEKTESENISEEKLAGMKVEELRNMAGDMGLKKNGSREELISRIMQELENEESGTEELNLREADIN